MENNTQSIYEWVKSLEDRIRVRETQGDNLCKYVNEYSDRLDALEAKRSTRTVSLAVGDTVYSETVAAGETIKDTLKALQDAIAANDHKALIIAAEVYGMASVQYQKIRADLSTNGIKMMTPDEVKANLRRDEPNVATINDLFDKIKDQAATVEAMMGENAELFDQSDRDADTIATLNTEIATRDRLLDDQAATIGKLERERDEAKAVLQLVQTRVVGLDLNNIDKMRGQQWVKATRKKQQRVVCDFYGDPVTVPMGMPEMGVQELRSRILRGWSK